MEFSIDRSSGTPVWRQIKGTIEYAIACGELPIGACLPSVRELAEDLAVAPMTINQAYADLKREGLVEARAGSGTYVTDSVKAQMAMRPEIDRLHWEIDRLLDYGESIGVSAGELAALLTQRVALRNSLGRQTSIVIVGLFAEATERYARQVGRQLGELATVRPMTMDAIQTDPGTKAAAGGADLIITFSNLRPEVAAMFPTTKVVALRFIPSEETRLRLASLDPLARVAVASKFIDFLPIIRSGVQRFAPHVRDIVAMNEDDPAVPDLLADRDVIVFATGADAVARSAPTGAHLIEYSHIPDPGDVDRVVRPFVSRADMSKPRTRKAGP